MAGAAGGLTALAAVAAGQPVLVLSFDDWRAAARALVQHGVPPHALTWSSRPGDGDLFAGLGGAPAAAATAPATTAPTAAATAGDVTAGAVTAGAVSAGPVTAVLPAPATLRLPRQMVEQLASAACFRAPDRWAFLYRVLWRWQHGEHDVLSAADGDGARLHKMVKSVRREEHDMHAYIRFRERPEASGAPRFVAWFEPAHDVLAQVAQHFSERMGGVTWVIATPDASVAWDGAALHMAGPLPHGAADIDDAGEALWRTYYRSIFNPARLNMRLLNSHIPSRFWKHLPEGSEVPEMVSQAAAGMRRTGQSEAVGRRSGHVIEIAAGQPRPGPKRPAVPDASDASGPSGPSDLFGPAEPANPANSSETPDQLAACRRCDLWQHATQAVGGVGPGTAPIMLVGEQPGDQEDLAGLPFVGPAGQVLERALRGAGLQRGAVYVTNAVKHFKWEPRGKRRLHKTPAQQEVAACAHWLARELASVAPQVVVALGATALKALTGDSHASLAPVLGQPFRHDGRWIIAVYHPSYVLRLRDDAGREQALAVIVDGLAQASRLLQRGAQPPAR